MKELEAGRELDKLVAEKVMGIETEWYHYEPKGCYRLVKKGCATDAWTAAMRESSIPDYSTNISDAWKVIEHLAREPYAWEINTINATDGLMWDATIWGGDADEDEDDYADIIEIYSSVAPAAPLAICRAALEFAGRSKTEFATSPQTTNPPRTVI